MKLYIQEVNLWLPLQKIIKNLVKYQKKPKMWLLALETTFNHKALNLFKGLNIEISLRTITKSHTIFNTNRARNMVTIWMYLKILCKNISTWIKNNPYFFNKGYFLVTHIKKSPKHSARKLIY